MSLLLSGAIATLLPGIALAADTSVCTSLCTSARKECRAKVPLAVDLDRMPLIVNEEKNPIAYAASRGQPTSNVARIQDRSDNESRRIERNGMCDDSYQRCARGCAAPAAPGTSELLTQKGRARAARP